MFRGKKYKESAKQIDKTMLYDAADGMALICKTASAKFDETVELHVKLGVEKHEIVVLYNVGDTVKITDGPLASFMGTVEEIDADKNKVRVVVSMFGRETPVELELDQVEVVQP